MDKLDHHKYIVEIHQVQMSVDHVNPVHQILQANNCHVEILQVVHKDFSIRPFGAVTD